MQYRVITAIGLALLLFGLGSVGSAVELASSVQPQTYQGISYLSGGIGEEERDALRQMDREYNVKLIFAAKDGVYVSNVNVTIEDGSGKKVLEAVSDGPWFYAKLPPGKYNVMAQVRGQTHKRVVEVGQKKQAQFQFSW